MRRIVVACALVGLMSDALAADYQLPILRGSNSFLPPATSVQPSWYGIYGGAFWGYNSASMNFGSSASSIISYLLRNTAVEEHLQVSSWTVLEKKTTTDSNPGGFAGFNYLWDSVVLGLEAYYSRAALTATSTDSMARLQDVENIRYAVALNAGATVSMTDLGGVRARLGYAAGSFLPYATVGAAIGRGSVTRFVTLTETETDITDPANPIPIGGLGTISRIEDEQSKFMFGYSFGLGMDIMLMQHVFVRGEWEYLHFPSVSGTRITINAGRIGAGIKF
jgi:opacity protein-like surface antigen